MKRPARPFLLSVLVLASAAIHPCAAASTSTAEARAAIAAVTAADDERVAASIAKDRARLDAVFSDELHYSHSNGKVDTKTTYVDSIASGASVYGSFDYKERSFKPIAPGVVLMSGRALIQSRNAAGPVMLDLNFLAVWRQENGTWRFVAWQSCRNPPPTP